MKLRIMGITLAVLLLLVPNVFAQGPGGRGGGPGGRGGMGLGPLTLLNVEAVQKEIELLDEQIADIQALAEKLRPQPPAGGRPNFQEMTDQERQQFMADRQKEAAELAAKAKKELSSILLDDQLARLQEIYIQVAGTQALDDADVAKDLGLNEQQKEKLAAAREDAQASMREQMRELFQSDDRDAAREKMQELRKQSEEKVLAVLTTDQQNKFASMKGKPFEMPEGALFGGRGQGGRGQGGRGQGGGGRRGNNNNNNN